MYVVNRTRSTYLGVDIRLANSFRSRLMGLQAYREIPFGDGVWLVPCNSIVTFRMRVAIDAVFLDMDGRVVRVVENIAPGKIVWPIAGTHSVLELPVGVVRSSETREGDTIECIDDVARPGRSRDGEARASRASTEKDASSLGRD
jgi:hypothetical protein